MIRCDRPERVPVPIQTFTQLAVRVEVFQFLVKRLVWKRLIRGMVEILARVSDPVDFQAQLAANIDQRSNAPQKRCRSARFQYEHVRVDEQGAFGQDIGIQVVVRNAGNNFAASTLANAIQIGTAQSAQAHVAGATFVLFLIPYFFFVRNFLVTLTKYNFQCFLRAFKDSSVVSVDHITGLFVRKEFGIASLCTLGDHHDLIQRIRNIRRTVF